MSKKVIVHNVNNKMLEWARKSMGYAIADIESIKSYKFNKGDLSEIENGKKFET